MKEKYFWQISINSLAVLFLILILAPPNALALTPGALVYRTTNDGKMFGYSSRDLLEVENRILKSINPGHVGIYIGKGSDGVHYIVEALAGGIVKTPAQYFVNEALGEKLLGAKIPKYASPAQRLKAIKIAESLVGQKLGYDFDFKNQKGPDDGDWTCVGLVEKVYESANISNPNNRGALEYDPNFYAVNITPDGFDNKSVINQAGDCFAQNVEYSKIARRQNIILPLPEVYGFNAGLEYQGDRYIFLPYTQYLQSSLKSEQIDIDLSSNFSSQEVRGKTPVAKLFLRWSLINNPLSSLKNVIQEKKTEISSLISSILGKEPETEIVLNDLPVAGSLESEIIYEPLNINQTNNASDKSFNDSLVDNKLSKDNLKTDLNSSTNTNSSLKITTVSQNNNDESQVLDNRANLKTDNVTENKNLKNNNEPSESIVIPKITQNSNTGQVNPIASLTTKIAATSENNSLNVDVNKNQTNSLSGGVLVSKISAGVKTNTSTQTTNTNQTNSGSSNTNASLNSINLESISRELVINKIYATQNNDFIELYNPTNTPFDLAEAEIRLEKAKTAEDPSLMMRIGNLSDGLYPGGTMIAAKGYYLIVRDDASNYHLNLADAIATRSEFNFTGSGYIIYLGNAALSSSLDEDMIDAVGFGEAKYFQGSAPAPVITDNYYLNRLKNTHNNGSDFNLLVSADPDIIWEDEESSNSDNLLNNNDDDNDINNENTETETTEEENNEQGTESENNNEQNNEEDNQSEEDSPPLEIDWLSDFTAFSLPEPIVSDGVVQFWNFSECYGENYYSVGKFDCAMEFSYVYPSFAYTLNEPIDANQLTLSFYYRNSKRFSTDPRVVFNLSNRTGQRINLLLEAALFQAEGLPNTNWRYYNAPTMLDESWHHFALVINKAESYWAAYFDGVEKYRHFFTQTMANNFLDLEFSSDMGTVAVDEVVLWNRSLEPSEIKDNFERNAPFNPIFEREEQLPAQLKHFWDFNEGHELVNIGGGEIATDSVGGLTLHLPPDSWIWRASENTGIINKWSKDLNVEFLEPLTRKDLSLSFWWRSKYYPLDGRSLITLRHNDGAKLGISPDHYRRSFYFNDQYGVFSEGQDLDLPFDENWHHFAVTYDSFRYQLKLFIDGEEKSSKPFFWIKDGEEPNNLLIKNELNSVELDDLGVWEGALTPLQVKSIFQNSR